MKTYNHIYEKVLEHDNLVKAIKAVRRTSIYRKRYFEDEEKSVRRLYNWIIDYEIVLHTPIEIFEGVKHKQRKILVPSNRELAVQHAVINVLQPIFMKGMYEHSYASIPGRGAHKAKKYIEKWIRKYPYRCKYVLKMDIRHFFDSIPHDKMKEKFRKVIKDEQMLDLLYKIIDVNSYMSDTGLPLGFYTSQWFANWYLQDLDHFIKEDLKAKYYVRYMDDMVIFGSNKKELHDIRQKISWYLEDFGLTLKDDWQVFRFDYINYKGEHKGRDLDFMGFRFYRDRTVLRKSIMLKSTRKANKIQRKGRANIHDIRQMLSYMGWVDCTDTYNVYLSRIKPYANIQEYKRRVSQYDRRREEKKKNANYIQ